MKTILQIVAASLIAISGFADQIVLKGSEAIAKFPARLQNSEIAHLADASWCQLMPGVEYYYGKFDLLYNTTKNDVSFYKIDYRNAPVRMKFVDNRRNGGSNKQTSYVANKYNALFGINCTFPAWYSKMEGTVVNDGNKEGGLALNDDKTFEFFPSSWWTTPNNVANYSDVFSTEAMGLYHGSQGLSGTGWGQAPYTFMGVTQDGILYVCVVDGRSSRSEGLGYGTTHSFLVELGCYDGMCIDGGGSTTMVCRKDLMPSGMNELQHSSDNSAANPYYYTMNHTSDNPERAVCNQLLFVEDVANVTPDVGRHGSCSLGSTALGTALVKFDKNVTQTLSVTADTGYVIAALSVDGVMVSNARGCASYSDSILLNGDKSIAVSFVREGAWWLNPTVKNDFLLETKSGNNGTDLTTQHPDVCLDEQEKDVFFATSVHGYSSGSYWSAIHEYSVANLKGWQTGDAIAPVMGTRKNLVSGDYAYSIAASRAAGVALAMQKTTGGTKYPVVYPIGGQWGGGTEFNSTRDDRYVEAKLSFPDDKTGYHSAYPCVFGTDGTYLYGGYNRNAHIHEFRVTTDASGHRQFVHTGKVIKHKAAVTAVVCKKVTLGGQAKDVLFTSHHSSTIDSLDIVIPGEMAVQTNSSSLPTCLNIPYKLDNIAVTGIADGTPRVIGHVLDTNNPQHGDYVVYDLKDDLSGLRFSDPIAIVDATAVFNKATGSMASLDDDSAAFINYYNGKALYAMTVVGAGIEPELTEIAQPAAVTGLVYNGASQSGVAAGTGYTVANGSAVNAGSYTATVTPDDGYCWAGGSTDFISLPWSIAKIPVTVTANSITIKLDASLPLFGYAVTSGTLVAGETLSGAPACAADGRTEGKWTITQGSLTDANNPNYAITFSPGLLTVRRAPDWLDPAEMAGATLKDKTEAALKAQGFDDETAAAVAGAGAYGDLSAWAQDWADSWQTRGASEKPMPSDIAGLSGLLTSAAIGADDLLEPGDVMIDEITPESDGDYTLTVTLGDGKNLTGGNEELLKAALGVAGSYGFGDGQLFSADNVDVTSKTVEAEAVEMKAVPKPQNGNRPDRFFFRAIAK